MFKKSIKALLRPPFLAVRCVARSFGDYGLMRQPLRATLIAVGAGFGFPMGVALALVVLA